MKLVMAQQYLNSGKKQEALMLLNQVISEEPDNVSAVYSVASLLLSSKRYESAKPFLERVLELDPGHLQARLRLATILHDEGKTEAMLALLAKLHDKVGDNLISVMQLAKVYQQTGQTTLAEQYYLYALGMEDNRYEVHSALGGLYRDLGQIGKAKEHFRKSITINPESAGDYYALALLCNAEESRENIPELQTLYDGNKALNTQQKMFFCYALGKSYEDIGEYEKAFGYLLEANRFDGELEKYSREKTSKRFSNIKNVFSERFFHYHKGLGVESKMPIFIVGMPRSGTTLTEQILASHPQVHGAGELVDLHSLTFHMQTYTNKPFPLDINIFSDAQYQQMANRYLSKLQALSGGKNFVTDKMPNNFLYIGLINLLFPNAKIIHCSRNPIDTCLSLFRHNFSGSHAYAHNLEDLADYYKKYMDIMSHWHQVLPFKIYDVVYEDLVANTEEEVRAILNYCGLPFDAACLNFHETQRQVATASAGQVRSTISDKSISKWKHYEQQLQPLVEALGMQGL